MYYRINKSAFYCIAYVFLLNFCYQPTDGGDVPLNITSENVDKILESNELVLINFYATWCGYSRALEPIFEIVARMVKKYYPEPGRVVLGSVNCEEEKELSRRFSIIKYPTLKLVRHGVLSKYEYRSARTIEAIYEYIEKEIKGPIKILNNTADFTSESIAPTPLRRVIFGYFDSSEQAEYKNFENAASFFKSDCEFYVGLGEVAKSLNPSGNPTMVYNNNDSFKGNMTNFEEIKYWMHNMCIPLIKEITFQNAEEFTEEGKPFLILFHDPKDEKSLERFKEAIERELMDEQPKVNFLRADANKFTHPLHHVGKKPSDAPLIAIDSLRHMYLFKRFEDIYIPGKLKDFVKDLHSGSLHRQFHYGPDPTTEKEAIAAESTTFASTFQKLMPATDRYSFKKIEKDEL